MRPTTHDASLHVLDRASAVALRDLLLPWFESVRDKRGMPWRKKYDSTLSPEERAQRAYEIWICEIMSQQTQIATVIPYYKAWMQRFPTLKDLAASDIDTVNALWKGLGYYSRAARLLKGAQVAVADHGGMLPDTAEALQKHIPGIGRYSAGAIASIAYSERAPVLDGNVNRLLSRVLALHANPKAKSTLDILWAAAAAVVEDSDSPGDVNEGLIELGSTICTPRAPKCAECPLRSRCLAYNASSTAVTDIEDACMICEPLSESGVEQYPMKVVRKKAREELDVVSVIEWRSTPESADRRFALERRPSEGLLGGLFQFPTFTDTTEDDLNPEDILSTHVSLDGNSEVLYIRQAGEVLHVFSHIRKVYRVQWVLIAGGDAPPSLKSAPIVKQPPKKRQKTPSNAKCAPNVLEASSVIWLAEDDVAKSNIGVGVSKVWEAARKLWGKEQPQKAKASKRNTQSSKSQTDIRAFLG